MLVFLILAAVAAVSCAPTAVWNDSPEREHLYAAVTRNTLLPPEDFTATLDGPSPQLTWKERKEAYGYRIYRAAGSDGEWHPVTTVPVTGTVFTDTEISVTTHSGIWRYAVASVNDAGTEGFRSSEATVTVFTPEYRETVRVLSASAGGFPHREGGADPLSAVRIIFEPADGADAYAVLRREPGKGSRLLTEAAEIIEMTSFSSDRHTDSPVSRVVCYYDKTAQPGIIYGYRIVPIDGLGRYGRESESVEGFVFPKPQTEAWDVSAEKAAVRVFVPSEFRQKVHAFRILFRDSDAGEPLSRVFDLRYGFSDYLVLKENEIRSILDGRDSRWLNISVAVLFEDGEKEILSSGLSDEQSVLFFSRESSSLPVPSFVAVAHGKKNEAGVIDSPVVLKWKKPSDRRIRGYRIYRTDKLLMQEGVDRSEWSPAVGDVVTDSFTEFISWSDSSFDRFGAFYYKINPYADENTETQNNRTASSFVCAAVFPSELPPLKASCRSYTDKVRLSWNEIPGINIYHFHSYPVQIGEDLHIRFAGVGFETSESCFYDFSLTTPGPVDFRYEPVVVFSDGNRELGSVSGGYSAPAVGAVELETSDWVRYVMTTVAAGQRMIPVGSRKHNVQCKVGNLSFYRRYTALSWTYGYDLYGFSNYPDRNGAFSVSGTLIHIYYKKKSETLNFSFSGDYPMPLSDSELKAIDRSRKGVGYLTVTGLYPGKLYVWGANQGAEAADRAEGLLPGREFPNPLGLSCTAGFAADYGFDFSYPVGIGYRGETTYAAVRDDRSGFEPVSYDSIGSIGYLGY